MAASGSCLLQPSNENPSSRFNYGQENSAVDSMHSTQFRWKWMQDGSPVHINSFNSKKISWAEVLYFKLPRFKLLCQNSCTKLISFKMRRKSSQIPFATFASVGKSYGKSKRTLCLRCRCVHYSDCESLLLDSNYANQMLLAIVFISKFALKWNPYACESSAPVQVTQFVVGSCFELKFQNARTHGERESAKIFSDISSFCWSGVSCRLPVFLSSEWCSLWRHNGWTSWQREPFRNWSIVRRHNSAASNHHQWCIQVK